MATTMMTTKAMIKHEKVKGYHVGRRQLVIHKLIKFYLQLVMVKKLFSGSILTHDMEIEKRDGQRNNERRKTKALNKLLQ